MNKDDLRRKQLEREATRLLRRDAAARRRQSNKPRPQLAGWKVSLTRWARKHLKWTGTVESVQSREKELKMNTITSRTADSHLQDAVNDVMLWATLGLDACPTCGVSTTAWDYMPDADRDAWWQFIFKVRQWLECDYSAARYDKAKASKDLNDMLNNMLIPVILKTREADAGAQRAIVDLIAWSVASAQAKCCGISLGPDESAAHSIALLCEWLEITHEELEAIGQRWTFQPGFSPTTTSIN
jgi:hypothetical protein